MEAAPPGQARTRWPRLGLESVTIVLSILLAFAIDAGWDERQDRRAEAEVLQSLAVEFERYIDRFGQRADFYEELAENIVWLLDEADESATGLRRLDEGLLALVGAPTFEVGGGVNTELVASGRVALISDPILRHRVATWQGRLNEITDDEIVVRQYVTTVMVPYLASRNAPLGRASSIPKGASWRLSVPSDGDALAAYRALLNEPEFRALASWRYDWALSSARGFDRGGAAADSVLSLVRTSLGG